MPLFLGVVVVLGRTVPLFLGVVVLGEVVLGLTVLFPLGVVVVRGRTVPEFLGVVVLGLIALFPLGVIILGRTISPLPLIIECVVFLVLFSATLLLRLLRPTLAL